MANSTDSYISKISQINPDEILRTHNFGLPGLKDQIIYFDPLPEISSPEECICKFMKIEDEVLVVKIQDTSLLSNTYADVYEFEEDYLAICGKSYVVVCDLNLRSLQTYCIKSLREDLLTVTWGVLNGDLQVATAGRLGQIHVFNLQNYKSHTLLSGHLNSINCVRYLPKSPSLLLSASDDLSIRLWNTLSKIQISIFKNHSQGVLYLDIHHSVEIFASGSKDSSIKLWSLLPHSSIIEFSQSWTGDNFPVLEVQKPVFSDNKLHLGYVDCVKFIHNLIISKSQTGEIVIWKTTGALNDVIVVVKVIKIPCFGEINIKFAICKRKKLLAIGDMTGQCFVYRLDWLETDNYLCILSENEGIIRNVEISKECLITASTTGRIQIQKFVFFQSKV